MQAYYWWQSPGSSSWYRGCWLWKIARYRKFLAKPSSELAFNVNCHTILCIPATWYGVHWGAVICNPQLMNIFQYSIILINNDLTAMFEFLFSSDILIVDCKSEVCWRIKFGDGRCRSSSCSSRYSTVSHLDSWDLSCLSTDLANYSPNFSRTYSLL